MSTIQLTLSDVTPTGCTLSDGTDTFVFSNISQSITPTKKNNETKPSYHLYIL